MKTKFTTQLAPPMTNGWGGAKSGGHISPSQWADELYGAEVPGPMLCCYMLRRFGWPNAGSDDHKELMAWNLTTPMPGLCLLVVPYLGHQDSVDEKTFKKNTKFGCGNMHFGYRHSKDIGSKIHSNPQREAYFKRYEAAVERWWKTKGRKLYTFGCATKSEGESLIAEWSESRKHKGHFWGLWNKIPKHIKLKKLQKMQMHWLTRWPRAHQWLGEFLRKSHPDVKLPKWTKRERNAPKLSMFGIQCRAAIKAALRDLMRPTNVRDLCITPFGDIERNKLAIRLHAKFPDKREFASRFIGAGYSPEYWYKDATPKER